MSENLPDRGTSGEDAGLSEVLSILSHLPDPIVRVWVAGTVHPNELWQALVLRSSIAASEGHDP